MINIFYHHPYSITLSISWYAWGLPIDSLVQDYSISIAWNGISYVLFKCFEI